MDCTEKLITVKVMPRASKTKILQTLEDGTLKIALKAVPENGKANTELLRFMNTEFGGNWKLVAGKKNSKKILKKL